MADPVVIDPAAPPPPTIAFETPYPGLPRPENTVTNRTTLTGSVRTNGDGNGADVSNGYETRGFASTTSTINLGGGRSVKAEVTGVGETLLEPQDYYDQDPLALKRGTLTYTDGRSQSTAGLWSTQTPYGRVPVIGGREQITLGRIGGPNVVSDTTIGYFNPLDQLFAYSSLDLSGTDGKTSKGIGVCYASLPDDDGTPVSSVEQHSLLSGSLGTGRVTASNQTMLVVGENGFTPLQQERLATSYNSEKLGATLDYVFVPAQNDDPRSGQFVEDIHTFTLDFNWTPAQGLLLGANILASPDNAISVGADVAYGPRVWGRNLAGVYGYYNYSSQELFGETLESHELGGNVALQRGPFTTFAGAALLRGSPIPLFAGEAGRQSTIFNPTFSERYQLKTKWADVDFMAGVSLATTDANTVALDRAGFQITFQPHKPKAASSHSFVDTAWAAIQDISWRVLNTAIFPPRKTEPTQKHFGLDTLECGMCHNKREANGQMSTLVLEKRQDSCSNFDHRIEGHSKTDSKVLCKTCHGMSESGFMMLPTMGICLTCHDSELNNEIIQENAKKGIKLASTCQICHTANGGGLETDLECGEFMPQNGTGVYAAWDHGEMTGGVDATGQVYELPDAQREFWKAKEGHGIASKSKVTECLQCHHEGQIKAPLCEPCHNADAGATPPAFHAQASGGNPLWTGMNLGTSVWRQQGHLKTLTTASCTNGCHELSVPADHQTSFCADCHDHRGQDEVGLKSDGARCDMTDPELANNHALWAGDGNSGAACTTCHTNAHSDQAALDCQSCHGAETFASCAENQ